MKSDFYRKDRNAGDKRVINMNVIKMTSNILIIDYGLAINDKIIKFILISIKFSI